MVDQLVGATVYDASGDKIGRVRRLYLSALSRRPKWVTVRTGLFGVHKSLVPLAGARFTARNSVQVAVAKDAVRHAPQFHGGDCIAEEEQERLLQHYGLPENASNTPQPMDLHPTPTKHSATLAAAAAAGIGGTAANTSAVTAPPPAHDE